MTPEELRSDFEIGLLFPDETRPDVGPGCLKKNKDGRYDSPTIQNAWLGYQMCAKYAHALLERYNPDRSVTPGMVTQLSEELDKAGYLRENDDDLDRVFAAVLRVAGGSPI